jgi:hypothetical protein
MVAERVRGVEVERRGDGVREARSRLRPGQVFVFRSNSLWECNEPEALLVVLDERSEVEFWTGARWQCGYVCPGSHFEVVS